jgi:uncharacterized protein (TIGR00369 family)
MTGQGAALKDVIAALPFVRSHGIEIVALDGGRSTVRMPFVSQHSTPPGNFPAGIVGLVGDVAAISACTSAAPAGHACATLDFTVKMTGQAAGAALLAEGRALEVGKTFAVGAADIYVMDGEEKRLCGTVLASGRIYQVKG